MGPNIFTCNENSAYIMPHVSARAVMSCMYCTVYTCQQASHPYVNMAHQKLLMGMLFMPAKLYLRKVTASHFSTLNMKIVNQNVLKRILIAMHNENKADCNENFSKPHDQKELQGITHHYILYSNHLFIYFI